MSQTKEKKEDRTFFKDSLSKAVSGLVSPHIKVSVGDYMKNNRTFRTGVSFIPDENELCGRLANVSPIIYVDHYYEAYLEGRMTIEEIADLVSEEYFKYLDYPMGSMDFLEDFEKARARIAMRLMNLGANEEFLANVPHEIFLDLAIVFFYMMENEGGELLSMTITNSLMKDWHISVRDLFLAARENTPGLLPARLSPLSEMLSTDIDAEEKPLFVLTNTSGAHGAAALIYEGLADRIADALSDDYYILPCSVHELILVKKSFACEVERMRDIVSEVNRTTVRSEEYLSDNVYFYSRNSKLVEIA